MSVSPPHGPLVRGTRACTQASLHAKERWYGTPPDEGAPAIAVGCADGTRTRRVPGNARIAPDSGPGVSAVAAGRRPLHEGVRPSRLRGIPPTDEHGLLSRVP